MSIILYCNTCKNMTEHTWTNTFSVGIKKVELYKCINGKHGQAIEK